MPAAQTPKQAGAFSPFLSQQLPGGSEILDRNLLAIKAAIGEVVDQFNRTITFIGVGGDGSAGPYVPTARRINTVSPLAGGGDLSADLTLSVALNYQTIYDGNDGAMPAEAGLQFGQPAGATLTVTDDPGSGFTRVDLAVLGAATVGSSTSLVNLLQFDNYGRFSGGTALGVSSPLLISGGNLQISTFGASGGGHARGAVPDPGAIAGTTHFLREDATWAVPPDTTGITQLTGDVTAGPGSGSVAATIAAHAVTYHKMQQETPGTILGNPTAGVADVQEIVLGGGLEFATPGPTVIQRSALTGDVTAPAGSNVTTLATVATPGTYGSTGSYLASQTIDAKGRTTAVSVTSTPLAGALVYTLASTTLAMGQNQSTLVMPLPAGPPIINTAAAGVALSTTLSANWGSSVQSPPTFFTQIGSIKCTGDITFYSSSGGGQPVLVVALWYVTGNAFLPGSWHALASQSLTLNIGTGSARAAINFSASSTSGLVPNDASLVLVLYRSDANAGTTLNTINANIVCSWGV
jgi:hypothetical protein